MLARPVRELRSRLLQHRAHLAPRLHRRIAPAIPSRSASLTLHGECCVCTVRTHTRFVREWVLVCVPVCILVPVRVRVCVCEG